MVKPVHYLALVMMTEGNGFTPESAAGGYKDNCTLDSALVAVGRFQPGLLTCRGSIEKPWLPRPAHG